MLVEEASLGDKVGVLQSGQVGEGINQVGGAEWAVGVDGKVRLLAGISIRIPEQERDLALINRGAVNEVSDDIPCVIDLLAVVGEKEDDRGLIDLSLRLFDDRRDDKIGVQDGVVVFVDCFSLFVVQVRLVGDRVVLVIEEPVFRRVAAFVLVVAAHEVEEEDFVACGILFQYLVEEGEDGFVVLFGDRQIVDLVRFPGDDSVAVSPFIDHRLGADPVGFEARVAE